MTADAASTTEDRSIARGSGQHATVDVSVRSRRVWCQRKLRGTSRTSMRGQAALTARGCCVLQPALMGRAITGEGARLR
jgi:hypothetical protein